MAIVTLSSHGLNKILVYIPPLFCTTPYASLGTIVWYSTTSVPFGNERPRCNVHTLSAFVAHYFQFDFLMKGNRGCNQRYCQQCVKASSNSPRTFPPAAHKHASTRRGRRAESQQRPAISQAPLFPGSVLQAFTELLRELVKIERTNRSRRTSCRYFPRMRHATILRAYPPCFASATVRLWLF